MFIATERSYPVRKNDFQSGAQHGDLPETVQIIQHAHNLP